MTEPDRTSRPAGDPRVLVVEDEARLRELLQRVITGWGFDVQVARSAEEAWRLATAEGGWEPDVAVLDLNLPGEGGIELFRRLRARLPRVQGIVLTGFASLEAAREAIHLDVVEFLTKPCHLGELEQALDRAIRRLAPPGQPVGGPVLGPEGEAAGDEDDAAAAAAAPAVVPASTGPAGKTLEEVERDHILAALVRHNGNRTATAAELGISRRTLYYKLDGYQKQGFATG